MNSEAGVIVICVSLGIVFPRTYITDYSHSEVIVMGVSPGILFLHHLYAD